LPTIIIPANSTQRQLVADLLTTENLPVADLPNPLENFVIAINNQIIVGTAGLEVYGSYGLLRSVAVSSQYRGKQIAQQLLVAIEDIAKAKRLTEIYLLTETAELYFKKKGFLNIHRQHVPAEIKASSEFAHVCPVSAVVMKKMVQPV